MRVACPRTRGRGLNLARTESDSDSVAAPGRARRPASSGLAGRPRGDWQAESDSEPRSTSLASWQCARSVKARGTCQGKGPRLSHAKMFKKTIRFTANCNSQNADLEIDLQRIASSYGFAPKIREVCKFADRYEVTMDKIDGMSLADKYSDDPKEIRKEIWDQIHAILTKLYELEGIEYIDITGYNFIKKDSDVHIIDFGHALYTKAGQCNWFLRSFLDGEYGWNPDFA